MGMDQGPSGDEKLAWYSDGPSKMTYVYNGIRVK